MIFAAYALYGVQFMHILYAKKTGPEVFANSNLQLCGLTARSWMLVASCYQVGSANVKASNFDEEQFNFGIASGSSKRCKYKAVLLFSFVTWVGGVL